MQYRLRKVISAIFLSTLCATAVLYAENAEESFEECRANVIKAWTNKKLTRAELQLQLGRCKVSFPAAAVYLDCKASLIPLYKKDPAAAKQRLDDCRKQQALTVYSPEEPIQWKAAGKSHYFAGIDFNTVAHQKSKDSLPNFNCKRVTDTIQGYEDPDYVLFGNELAVFPAIATIDRSKIMGKLKAKKLRDQNTGQTYFNLPGIGHLFPSENGNPLLFFPASFCYFSGKIGSHFRDHKIYYLIDRKQKSLTPYFAASFFNRKKQKLSTKALQQKILPLLGPGYSAHKLASGSIFFAQSAPQSFDSDGDPKDVCQPGAGLGEYVALLRPDDKGVDAVFFANIKNLCQYANQVLSHLTNETHGTPKPKRGR